MIRKKFCKHDAKFIGTESDKQLGRMYVYNCTKCDETYKIPQSTLNLIRQSRGWIRFGNRT